MNKKDIKEAIKISLGTYVDEYSVAECFELMPLVDLAKAYLEVAEVMPDEYECDGCIENQCSCGRDVYNKLLKECKLITTKTLLTERFLLSRALIQLRKCYNILEKEHYNYRTLKPVKDLIKDLKKEIKNAVTKEEK